MADKDDIDFTYSAIDEIFRLSMGETGDFSGAMYNGDYTMSLEEAQHLKHKFIADQLGIGAGSKVLDMGCGWGPFVRYVEQERDATCLGLTLSQGQAKACQKNGLQVLVKDCRYAKPDDVGTFDAIASLGAFEHFCSVAEWKQGKQEEIYHQFFQTVYNLLPTRGRFFLQTMTFSKNMIDYEDIDIDADKKTKAYILGLMVKQFPGSWLPYGAEMVVRNAKPFFKCVWQSSGRLDYIETIGQWRKRFRKFNFRKYLLYLSLVPKYVKDREFRHQVAIFRISPNRVCFEQEIMDHYRMVFEKV